MVMNAGGKWQTIGEADVLIVARVVTAFQTRHLNDDGHVIRQV